MPVIPSQVNVETHSIIRGLAKGANAGYAVELGCWLGALTDTIASANPRLEVHSFDHFTALGKEPAKARAQGVELEPGQDTLPIVQSNLAHLSNVHLHKGDIRRAGWPIDWPIMLHIDDACKHPRVWEHVKRTFMPAWVPGQTIVALLDYHWLTHRRRFHQDRWVATMGSALVPIEDGWPVWLFVG